jgi:hypothetical protein
MLLAGFGASVKVTIPFILLLLLSSSMIFTAPSKPLTPALKAIGRDVQAIQ